MLIKVVTPYGTEIINSEERINCGGVLFRTLRDYFDDWVNSQPDQRELYFTYDEDLGGTYGEWRGAIEECYDAICDHCIENRKHTINAKDFWKLDLEGVMQI